jgi:hypothetical protein
MKYLKVFENHESYKKVTVDEFVAIDDNTDCEFNSSQFEKIKIYIENLFNKYYIINTDIELMSSFTNKLNSQIVASFEGSVYKNIFNIFIYICYKQDEWYYIEVSLDVDNGNGMFNHSNKFYKCDQWDGLLACLDKISLLE